MQNYRIELALIYRCTCTCTCTRRGALYYVIFFIPFSAGLPQTRTQTLLSPGPGRTTGASGVVPPSLCRRCPLGSGGPASETKDQARLALPESGRLLPSAGLSPFLPLPGHGAIPGLRSHFSLFTRTSGTYRTWIRVPGPTNFYIEQSIYFYRLQILSTTVVHDDCSCNRLWP